MLSHKRTDPRVDQSVEIHVVDSGQSEVEDVEGDGADGGEEAVEEDEVENAWVFVSTGR